MSPSLDEAVAALEAASAALAEPHHAYGSAYRGGLQEKWRAAYFQAFRMMTCGTRHVGGYVVTRTHDRLIVEPALPLRRAV
jgi:hypothetical protein